MRVRVKKNAVELIGYRFVTVDGNSHHVIAHQFHKKITRILCDDGISYDVFHPGYDRKKSALLAKKRDTTYVLVYDLKNGVWIIISNGVVRDKSYFNIKKFSEGLAPASSEMLSDSSFVWNYIDLTGNIVINGRFREAFPFSEGFARVKNDEGGFFYISKYSDPRDWIGYKDGVGIFDDADDFKDGVAWVKSSERGYCINKRGDELWREKGYMEVFPFRQGLARVKLSSGKFIFINRKGEQAFEGEFYSADDFGEIWKSAHVYPNEDDEKGYYIDPEGKKTYRFNK